MLLLIAGTSEGRVLFTRLKEAGQNLIITFYSDYGVQLIKGSSDCGTRIVRGPLDTESLSCLMKDNNVTRVIDASHPFAVEISKNAIEAARAQGAGYFRFERLPAFIPQNPLITRVKSFQEAAEEAVKLGEVIFLTIGVRNLEPFVVEAHRYGKKIAARVLPQESSLRACREKGLQPSQIAAVQGPGSRDLNKELLRHYCAGVLVTKDSGKEGGTAVKIEAALDLKIPVVLIERPYVDYGENVYYQVDDLIRAI